MRKSPWIMALALAVILALAIPALAADTPSDTKKQTKLGLYVTAKEAHGMWSADKDKVHVLDVRTPEEYVFVGHPNMAVNIPVKFFSHRYMPMAKHYAMPLNEQFVSQVKAKYKSDDVIICMCRSGGRSAEAVNILADAGFKKVYSVLDGFEGEEVKDKASPDFGKRVLDGWRNSNVPWTYDLDPALIYQVEKK